MEKNDQSVAREYLEEPDRIQEILLQLAIRNIDHRHFLLPDLLRLAGCSRRNATVRGYDRWCHCGLFHVAHVSPIFSERELWDN